MNTVSDLDLSLQLSPLILFLRKHPAVTEYFLCKMGKTRIVPTYCMWVSIEKYLIKHKPPKCSVQATIKVLITNTYETLLECPHPVFSLPGRRNAAGGMALYWLTLNAGNALNFKWWCWAFPTVLTYTSYAPHRSLYPDP